MMIFKCSCPNAGSKGGERIYCLRSTISGAFSTAPWPSYRKQGLCHLAETACRSWILAAGLAPALWMGSAMPAYARKDPAKYAPYTATPLYRCMKLEEAAGFGTPPYDAAKDILEDAAGIIAPRRHYYRNRPAELFRVIDDAMGRHDVVYAEGERRHFFAHPSDRCSRLPREGG